MHTHIHTHTYIYIYLVWTKAMCVHVCKYVCEGMCLCVSESNKNILIKLVLRVEKYITRKSPASSVFTVHRIFLV